MLELITSILNLMVVTATPLALAGVGEVYSERAGVLNLGLEGIMLMGAFLSFYYTYKTGSCLIGYLASLLVGIILGLLMAFMSVTLKLNQVIAGMGIFFLGFGLSDFLFRSIFGAEHVMIKKSAQVGLPILSKIPVVGGAFFKQYPMAYLSYILIPVMWFMLYKSRWGLSLRAVGENPRAADTLGVNVYLVRYLAVIIGSALAGIAGGFLCLAVVGLFFENLTFGMGFIAIGLVYFGKWDPLRTWAGSLLFGFAWSVSTTLQEVFTKMGYPSATYFLLMIPYLSIILALIAVSRGTRSPSALAVPYRREEAR